MADINMDNINIKIESSSENASGGITKLIETLTSLNGMLSNININADKFVRNMEKIKNINKVKGKVDNVTPKEDMKKKDIFNLFSNIKNPFNKYNEGSKEATQNTNRLNSVFETLAKTAGRLTISTGSFVSSLLKTRAIKIGASLIRMKDQISSILKSLKQYTTALFGIRSAFYAVRNVSNEFLNSQNAAAQQLKVNVGYLKYALGGSLAPIIRYISDLVYKVLQAVQYLVYYFTRINIFAGLTAESYKGIGTAAGKATKEAQKQLQAFDELNNITLEMNSASGSGGADDLIPEYDLSQVNMEMAALFEDIENLGKNLAEKINSALEGIEWDKILVGAEQLSLKIANILNDFTKYLNFEDIGYTVGQGFNTILTFVDTFFQTYDWKQLGIKLGQGFNKLIETVQWDKLGRVLTDRTRALILTVSNLISTIKWDELGAKIGEMLTSAFNNIPWESLGKLLNDAMIGVLDFVINFGKNFDSGKIVTAIVKVFSQINFAELLNKIVDVFKEGGFTSAALGSLLITRVLGSNGSLKLKLGLALTFTSLSLYSEGITGMENGEVTSEGLGKATLGALGLAGGTLAVTGNLKLAGLVFAGAESYSIGFDIGTEFRKAAPNSVDWYIQQFNFSWDEQNLFSKIAKLISVIGYSILDAIHNTIVNDVAPALDAMFQVLIKRPVIEFIYNLIYGLAEAIRKIPVIGEGIADGMISGLSGMEEYLEESADLTIQQALAGAYSKNVPKSELTGSNLIWKMAGGVQGAGKDFEQTLEQTINKSTGQAEPVIKLKGSEAASSWAYGYRDTTDKSYKEIADQVAETLSKVTEINIPNSTASAMEMAKTFTDKYGLSIKDSTDITSQVLKSFIAGIENGNLQEVGKSGEELAKTFTSKYGLSVKDSQAIVQQILQSFIQGSTDNVVPYASGGGFRIGEATVDALSNEIDNTNSKIEVKQSVSALVDSASQNISTSKYKDVGSNIVSGIESGMNGSKWSLSNTISKIGSSILSGFKNVLGIHSPSIVMERSIGKFIPLGLAKGIDNSAKAVYDSMDRIAENVANTEFKDMSTILELDTAIKLPNGKFSAEIDTNSRISLEDSMKQIAEYCYEAIKEGFDESEAPKVDVRIGDEKVYSGYSRFQSEASNQYGVTI